MAVLFLACILIDLGYSTDRRIPWAYDEIDNDVHDWHTTYPECGYSRQSPIDIAIDDETCEQPLLLDWESQTSHFVIRNNGNSLQAIPFEITYEGGSDLSNLEVLHHTNDTNIRLKNSFYNTYKSSVNAEYCFDSLHFHWAETNEYGSEHTINGKYYPLEVHLVHYSCDYFMSNKALEAYSTTKVPEKYDDNNVLAVIGVVFEIGEANPVLDEILSNIDGVRNYRNPQDINDNILELYYVEFDMMGLLPSNMEMVGYLGSLTTPPCYETVRWNVMKTPMTVSQKQLDDFRSILKSMNVNDTMAPNWRPVQDIGDRVVYQCQDTVDAEAVEKETVTNVVSEETDSTWFIIAVVVCCLFGVAIIIIGLLAYIVIAHRNKIGNTNNGNGYRQTKSEDVQDTQIKI